MNTLTAPYVNQVCKQRKRRHISCDMRRVGSEHHYNKCVTRDSPWTATVQRIHRTTDNTFTKAQHLPPPIRRRHSTPRHFPTTVHTQALERMIEACVQHAKTWLCDNGLVMNDNKSQAIVIRSSSLRTPTSLSSVSICGQLVDISPRYTGHWDYSLRPIYL